LIQPNLLKFVHRGGIARSVPGVDLHATRHLARRNELDTSILPTLLKFRRSVLQVLLRVCQKLTLSC
jgi:hypothetical protein